MTPLDALRAAYDAEIAVLGAPWRFPSDRPARRRFFVPEAYKHPAKLHLGLLQRLIDLYTEPGQTILDPMAGSGSLAIAATQMRNVILRDLEPSYVDLIQQSLPRLRCEAGLFAGLIDVGLADAKTLECPPFDHIIMSPPYACRTHSQGCKTAWDRAQSGRQVKLNGRWNWKGQGAVAMDGFAYANATGNNTGKKTGKRYWADMRAIYERCAMFLPAHGKLILILKNHIRGGQLIDVVSQTVEVIESLGLQLAARHGRQIDNPSLWQRRRRERGEAIVEVEDVLVFAVRAALSATR